eukprot:218284-Amphidinium_carterae.1
MVHKDVLSSFVTVSLRINQCCVVEGRAYLWRACKRPRGKLRAAKHFKKVRRTKPSKHRYWYARCRRLGMILQSQKTLDWRACQRADIRGCSAQQAWRKFRPTSLFIRKMVSQQVFTGTQALPIVIHCTLLANNIEEQT